MKDEITDEQRTVLEIKFKGNRRLFLNSGSFCAVHDPYYATRYAPIDELHPSRKEGRDKDVNWMKGTYDAEITFVPFLQACADYKKREKRRK